MDESERVPVLAGWHRDDGLGLKGDVKNRQLSVLDIPGHRAAHCTGDLRAVQAFARHAKPETTAGYTRASARRLSAVVNSIDYDATVD